MSILPAILDADRLQSIHSRCPGSQPSTRTQLLISFASHLHSAPSLWELTLEYMAACGAEGRHLIAEVLKRVDIDIDIPNPSAPTGLTNGNGASNGKSKKAAPKTPPRANHRSRAASEIEIDGHDDVDAHTEAEASAWKKWEDKVVKIIAVCKDYGLEDVMASVCKVGVCLGLNLVYTRLTQMSYPLVYISGAHATRDIWSCGAILCHGERRTRDRTYRRSAPSRIHYKRYFFLVIVRLPLYNTFSSNFRRRRVPHSGGQYPSPVSS